MILTTLIIFFKRKHLCYFLSFFFVLFYIWTRKLIKKIFEHNLVHEGGYKLDKLICSIHIIIFIFLMYFLSLIFLYKKK